MPGGLLVLTSVALQGGGLGAELSEHSLHAPLEIQLHIWGGGGEGGGGEAFRLGALRLSCPSLTLPPTSSFPENVFSLLFKPQKEPRSNQLRAGSLNPGQGWKTAF